MSSATSAGKGATNAAEPLANAAARSAFERLERSTGGQIQCVFSDVAARALRASLARRLTRTVAQVAEWEALVTDENTVVEGARLRRCYPELDRLWNRQVVQWHNFTATFVAHTASFLTGFDPNTHVTTLVADVSDLHNGNKTAVAVDLSTGGRWFYKPRSGTQERAWFTLLESINSLGFPWPFKVVRVESYGDHCWMEGVSSTACKAHEELRTFYYRAGALLYLVYCLRGVDFHVGNVIACGPNPVLVDCETIGHPSTPIPAGYGRNDQGVLRTGLIGKGPLNVSGFGCAQQGPHLPALDKMAVRPWEFVCEVRHGFSAMHSCLQQPRYRDALCRIAKSLDGAAMRIIHMPTARYAAILHASLSPRLLASGLERTEFLRAACSARANAPQRLAREVAALRDGDIPIFHGRGSVRVKLLSESVFRTALRTISCAMRPS